MTNGHTITVFPDTDGSGSAGIEVASIHQGCVIINETAGSARHRNPALYWAIQRIAVLEALCTAQQREIEAEEERS